MAMRQDVRTIIEQTRVYHGALQEERMWIMVRKWADICIRRGQERQEKIAGDYKCYMREGGGRADTYSLRLIGVHENLEGMTEAFVGIRTAAERELAEPESVISSRKIEDASRRLKSICRNATRGCDWWW